MYRVLRSYINYMTAWQQENFPTLPPKNPFDLVSHLLFCNGNGTIWLDKTNGNDHLAMQMEVKVAHKQSGWITFPFCDDETKSIHYNKKDEKHFSFYSQYSDFLTGIVSDLAWKINPELPEISLNDPEFWVKAVRKNYQDALKDARKFNSLWERYKTRTEMLSLGFPYDFRSPVNHAYRRYIPILNLLDFSNENNLTHNSKIFKLTSIINEAVIKVYSEIIESPEEQEILGDKFVADIRNKLNHFTKFHSENFFAIEFKSN